MHAGEPPGVGPREIGTQREDLGRFPGAAALKTIVFPSGAKRALKIGCWPERQLRERRAGGAALSPSAARRGRPPRRPPRGSPGPPRRAARAAAGRPSRRPAAPPGAESPESDSRSKARSRADWNRCSGFFSRQWRTMRSSARREILVRQREIGRVFPQDRGHRVRGGVAVERAVAREHLVEDRAEGEEVAAGVGRPSAHLLGRHVADRAEDDSRLGPSRRGRRGSSSPLPDVPPRCASSASRGRSRGS